ncbi:hypothetical protein GEMRC1_008474 [Eukaryota sp. GEM-RC1]
MGLNILITGCPGVGKSTVASLLAEKTNLTYLNIGDLVKDQGLHEGWDEELQTYILDEDALINTLSGVIEETGYVVEFHSPSVFPEDWFDIVVVLTCINDVLYPRLEKRGYSERKISDNIEAEIMEVVLDEAYETFPDKVMKFKCEVLEDIDIAINSVLQYIAENP